MVMVRVRVTVRVGGFKMDGMEFQAGKITVFVGHDAIRINVVPPEYALSDGVEEWFNRGWREE